MHLLQRRLESGIGGAGDGLLGDQHAQWCFKRLFGHGVCGIGFLHSLARQGQKLGRALCEVFGKNHTVLSQRMHFRNRERQQESILAGAVRRRDGTPSKRCTHRKQVTCIVFKCAHLVGQSTGTGHGPFANEVQGFYGAIGGPDHSLIGGKVELFAMRQKVVNLRGLHLCKRWERQKLLAEIAQQTRRWRQRRDSLWERREWIFHLASLAICMTISPCATLGGRKIKERCFP